MPTIINLTDHQKYRKMMRSDICFNKQEFDQLLSVYSQHVMIGEWKDYAIHHDPAMAAFLIYQKSSSHPSYTIVKRKTGSENTPEFFVYQGVKRLKKSFSLRSALTVLKKLELVI